MVLRSSELSVVVVSCMISDPCGFSVMLPQLRDQLAPRSVNVSSGQRILCSLLPLDLVVKRHLRYK